MKVIEMRVEKSDYHYKLLDSLTLMEIRCHEITEEFQSFLPTEQTLGDKFQRCHENKEEALRLWNLILKHKTTSISFDVDVMKTFSKTMEEKLDNVASLLMLSNSEVNDFQKKMFKAAQIVGLSKQLHTSIPEISRKFSDILPLDDEFITLSLVFDVASHLNHFSLRDLLFIGIKAKACHKLVDNIHSNFELECTFAYQLASIMRNKLLESMSGLLSQFLLLGTNILDLAQENKDQWKSLSEIVRTDNFDVDLLESRFNRAILLHHRVIKASIKNDCAKKVLQVLAFLVLGVTLYFYWKSEKG